MERIQAEVVSSCMLQYSTVYSSPKTLLTLSKFLQEQRNSVMLSMKDTTFTSFSRSLSDSQPGNLAWTDCPNMNYMHHSGLR